MPFMLFALINAAAFELQSKIKHFIVFHNIIIAKVLELLQ